MVGGAGSRDETESDAAVVLKGSGRSRPERGRTTGVGSHRRPTGSVKNAVMITARNARSARPRGSNLDGKNDPTAHLRNMQLDATCAGVGDRLSTCGGRAPIDSTIVSGIPPCGPLTNAFGPYVTLTHIPGTMLAPASAFDWSASVGCASQRSALPLAL